ncbi:MAG: transposase [Pseudomonadota bacterium]|nr:transposase [Pseudomonadota bacterium]
MKQRHTKEFKIQALELVNQLGSYAEAGRQLGIRDSALHTWKKKLKFEMKKDSEKNSNSNLESEEIKRLKKEVEELKKVNYILKRAAAFFSQDHLK